MAEGTSKQPEVNATSTLFQFIWIGVTSVVLLFLIYQSITDFKSLDEIPELFPITPAKAAEFGGTPAHVKVGLQISSFSVFDMINNNFALAGTVWFEFDPSMTSLETIGKFSFEKGEIKLLSPPSTRIIEGRLFARYNVRVELKTNLNQRLFPFTGHTLYIVLDNNYVSPAEITFESALKDFVLSRGIVVSGWKEYDRHVYTGYSVAELEKNNKEKTIYHPRAMFAIDFGFVGIRQILTILLPLILIFFISVFSFALDPKGYYTSILTISSGSITGLLAYRFVIENLSPRVGYFMLSDWLFFLFLTMTFVIFFANTKTLNLHVRSKEFITIVLHAIVIATAVYLFNFWV